MAAAASISMSISISSSMAAMAMTTLTPSPISTTFKPPPFSSPNNLPVIVVGAGLSGLSAATRLHSLNLPYLLLDSSPSVGGRVATDFYNGYTLDRGFQIFITAYPEARDLLDYDALHLHRFYSGAKVFYDGKFHTVADPLRHFADSLLSLSNPIGTVLDKLLIALTRVRVLSQSDYELLTADEVPTVELLRRIGFSDAIVDRFFRPFFGGIFFDRDLQTTSRLFDFVFRCLALGDNTLPRNGISAIPEQLAGKLNPNSLLLNSRVLSIDHESEEGTVAVNLENGDVLRTDLGVILAIDEFEAVKLLSGKLGPAEVKKPVRSTVCLYFSVDSDKVPTKDPVLFLNGSGQGIVNNMFFATNVAPSYAPLGKALVSVSLVGLYDNISDEELVEQVKEELSGWFGEVAVGAWSYLRMYRIGFAQPNQCPPTDLLKDPKLKPGLYVCGDYVTSATFDGALVSGRRAVEALLKDRAAVKV